MILVTGSILARADTVDELKMMVQTRESPAQRERPDRGVDEDDHAAPFRRRFL